MQFAQAGDALNAAIQLQRQHEDRIARWPEALRARLQVGVASGEVVAIDGDCFGDAVNVAARLAGMSGAGQIWCNTQAIALLPSWHHVRSRSLGAMMIRGKAEPQLLHQVEWSEHIATSILTMPAGLGGAPAPPDSVLGGIQLNWLDLQASFSPAQGAVVIGRDAAAQFQVNDSRVSRQHCRIEWQNTPSGGHVELVDTSSFGTWVRFAGGSNDVELRRTRCVLSTDGEIALGAPLTDFLAPTVRFSLSDTAVNVSMRFNPG